MLAKVASSVELEFTHRRGTSGLGDGDFTKTLGANGANSAQTVTVANIAGARYSVTFTPNVVGQWRVEVFQTSDPEITYYEDITVYDELDANILEVTGTDVTDVTDFHADVAGALATYDAATGTDVTNATTAIIAQVDANEAKIDIIDSNVDSLVTAVGALPTAAQVRDAILDRVLVGNHETAGSVGDYIVQTKENSVNRIEVNGANAYDVYDDAGTSIRRSGTTSAPEGYRRPA